MAKFHINEEKGEVGLCRAEQGGCPFGSEESHFDSMVDAAKAYEKSMESQIFNTASKSKEEPEEGSRANLGLKLTPSSSWEGGNYTTRQDEAELDRLSPGQLSIYRAIRSEVGPVLTHTDAHSMVQSWEMARTKTSTVSVGELEARAAEGKGVHDYLARTLTATPAAYGKYSTAEELEANLTDRVTESVKASRPYGQPEDEMVRDSMDRRERGLLQAASQLSGVDPREIRARVIDQTDVSRGFAAASNDELSKRIGYLRGLTRVTEAKKRELKAIEREVAIRDLTQKDHSSEYTYHAAKDHVKSGKLTVQEVGGLVGIPREETVAKLDDESRSFWEQNWR